MKIRSILTNTFLASTLAVSQNLLFVSNQHQANAQTEFSSCSPDFRSFLYQHSNGGGQGLHFCSDIAKLSRQCIRKDFFNNCDPSWNDRVSSVKSNSTITLWSDSNFRGRCIIINPRGKIINLADFGFDDQASSVRHGSFSGCEDKTSTASTPVEPVNLGFYRQQDRPEIYLVYRSGFYCHVQNEDQMNAFGGFGRVRVAGSLNLNGTNTGDCGWPNGFFRRSNQAEVYRMYGGGIPEFNIGDRYCHVANEAQMIAFGGFGQVRVVSSSSDTGRGRNSTGTCSNP